LAPNTWPRRQGCATRNTIVCSPSGSFGGGFLKSCGWLGKGENQVCEFVGVWVEPYLQYDQVSGGLIKMIASPEGWCGPASIREDSAPYFLDADSPTE